jgi:hypothetical protein
VFDCSNTVANQFGPFVLTAISGFFSVWLLQERKKSTSTHPNVSNHSTCQENTFQHVQQVETHKESIDRT